MGKKPEELFNQGVTALVKTNYPQAIEYFQSILKDDPYHAPSHYNLGIIYFRLGQLDRAIDHHLQAIQSQPNYDRAHFSLATIYFSQNLAEPAEFYFKTALALNPDLTDAYANLGLMAEQQQRLDTAYAYYHLGLTLQPEHPTLLAYALSLAQRYHDYPAATRLAKIYQKVLHRQLAAGEPPGPTPFISLLIDTDPQLDLHIARWWCGHLYTQIPHTRYAHHATPHSPLRLGYLSYDFRRHVIGHLITKLFDHHSAKFDVFLYNLYPPSDDPLSRRFAKHPGFTDVSHLSAPSIADRIHQDKIDILIDLTSFTKGGHPEICALRPAPIQISYLGLPGTSGGNFYDYIIADPILIPPEHEKFYTEKILRLPHYLVTSYGAPRLPPSAEGGRSAIFTFAGLTHPVKIPRSTVLLWFKILKAVPHSQLLLQQDNPTTTANLKAFAKKHYLDPARLVFLPRQSHPNFLHTIETIDLALDSPHYNGGGTTTDLLYAGVPVITLAGNRYVERMGTAILNAISLPELVTQSPQAYVDLAVYLATHPKHLKHLRTKLAAARNTAPLFDTQGWVNSLERGLMAIWDRYQHDLPPGHLTVS